MPCPVPDDDRNALPPQDPGAFKRVLSLHRHRPQRKRLQELAALIPPTDGVGRDLDMQLELIHKIRGDLALARKRGGELGHTYAERTRFMQEERELLSELGLTDNLYRKHDPLPGDDHA